MMTAPASPVWVPEVSAMKRIGALDLPSSSTLTDSS